MRTKRVELIEKEIITYTCDIDGCEFTTETNRGCCGFAPVMSCDICKKDACNKHREAYYEDPGSDYKDWLVCSDCKPLADKVWSLSLEMAGRHDWLPEVVQKILKEVQNGEWDEEFDDEKD